MKSSISDAPLTIGDLAARFGLATHVLRHWEAVGLLAPASRVSGRRRYGQPHVTRVALILRGKQAGLSLPAIRELVDAHDRASQRDLLARHQQAIKRQIAELTAAHTMIEHALACTADDLSSCPKLQAMLLGSGVTDEPGVPADHHGTPRRVWPCDATGVHPMPRAGAKDLGKNERPLW
jgi:MerR family transcriptional regulator, copper efflux regulator